MRSLDIEEQVVVGLSAAFAVLGLLFACVGIWTFADGTTLLGYANTFYYNSAGVSLFGLQPGWTLVPCGLLGVFPLIFALVATCWPSKGFLIFFIVYMCLLVLLELPMTVTVLASWPTTRSTLKSAMETSMKNDYVGMPYSYSHNSPNSLLFDKLFLENKCCGMNSNGDFTTNYATYASVWYTGYRSHSLGNGTAYTTTIPSACCMYNNPGTIISSSDWLNYRNYLVNQLCPVNQDSSYSASCFDILALYVYNVISVSIGCYIIVIILHVAAIVVAGVVYHTAHRVASQPDWTQYSNSNRVGNRGRGRLQQQEQEKNGGPYQGRPVKGNNPNSYGGGWGANSVYGRN